MHAYSTVHLAWGKREISTMYRWSLVHADIVRLILCMFVRKKSWILCWLTSPCISLQSFKMRWRKFECAHTHTHSVSQTYKFNQKNEATEMAKRANESLRCNKHKYAALKTFTLGKMQLNSLNLFKEIDSHVALYYLIFLFAMMLNIEKRQFLVFFCLSNL